MKKYKKYVIFGTVVNLMFYLLSLAPRVSAAQCQDFTCSLGYHTYHDHYLKSSDGSRQFSFFLTSTNFILSPK